MANNVRNRPMTMDAHRLNSLNLNSLVTFMVVYETGSVSRAAICLAINQSAVSNTLSKLRIYFKDPLFIRHSWGVSPTRKACFIARELSPAFEHIQKVCKTLAMD